MAQQKSWAIVGLIAALLVPAGGAAPVDFTVEPDIAPWLELLAPEVQVGGIHVLDGVISLRVESVEVTSPTGLVKVKVPWSFQQEEPLPYGYYRQATAQVQITEDGVQLAYDYIQREFQTSVWEEQGFFEFDVQLKGVEVRHELFVRQYASYYSSYPYQSLSQDGVSALVATGAPPLITERVTTAPVLRGPVLDAVDLRPPSFEPNLELTANFTVRDTAIAPDRFAILRVPYHYQRDTTHRGWGYEYGGAYFNAYDQDGQHLGSAGMSWYTDHGCCSQRLDLDVAGNLTAPLQFWGSEVRREIYVDVYMYWYGYACDPSVNCQWFGEGRSEYGFAGLVYTVPTDAPDISPNGLAQRALDLL